MKQKKAKENESEREREREKEKDELIGFCVSNKDVDNSLLQLVYAKYFTNSLFRLFYSADCCKIVFILSVQV